MTAMLILVRAIHIGSCLILFAMFAFDQFVAGSVPDNPNTTGRRSARGRGLNTILLLLISASGVAWFVTVGMAMGGKGFEFQVLKIVWTQTEFGALWKIRLLLWLMVMVFSIFRFSISGIAKSLLWIQVAVSGGLLGSLAWTGHGREGSDLHLVADVLHLLGAGMWPAGLLPFALRINELRRISVPEKWISIAALVRRFSAVSLGTVAILSATGWVNAWFLLGAPSNLVSQDYGRWLLAKIVLTCMAVAIGAVNLFRLKPRLLRPNFQLPFAAQAIARLQFNVLVELILSAAIVIIVAVLGILPPSAGGR